MKAQTFRQWLENISHMLDDLRGSFLTTEESLVTVAFCDGHMDHCTTLANLRQATEALTHKLAASEYDSENGTMAQVVQEIAQLYAIVANTKRIWVEQ